MHTETSMNNLALIYSDQCQWNKAEELQTEVLATRKQKLGVNHPSTLASINNLAMI
jgi:hypothetical protein